MTLSSIIIYPEQASKAAATTDRYIASALMVPSTGTTFTRKQVNQR